MDNNDILYYSTVLILSCIVIAVFYYLFFHKKQTIDEKFEISHKNKIDTFKAKIQDLEYKVNNLIENEPLEATNIDKERELFELFYKGVPDTYDLRGNLIRGVEPDAQKAIGYLQIIINSPYGTEHDILRLARIHHYGMHLFDKNLDRAEEIYNSLKFENISDETRTTIKEALADIQKIRVYTWLNLPLERPTINPDFAREVYIPDNIPDNIPVVLILPRDPRIRAVIQPILNLPAPIDQKEYNDPQNTHNPEVLSTIRVSLENLKASTPIVKSQGVTATEIRTYINGLRESDKKQDALKSLRAIESNPNRLSSTDMTEMDALTLVWNRINDPVKFSKEVSDNLKETMFDELASMQEFGATICSTGRFTHIIDTLNGVDEEVSIKPTYAINEEMMLIASNIREKMYEQFGPDERKLLETGTSKNQEQFETDLKKTILEKLKEDYVSTGILTESKFNNQVNSWINEI